MDILTQQDFLPWLAPQWDQLIRSIASDRIPPALLIHGQTGLGKTYLAQLWAQKLLCLNADGVKLPCGSCSACHLFQAGTHPDFMTVEPQDTGKSIGVDTIRQLIAKLSLKPQYNGYRIVLIEPADGLNINAANALLKTLEEPAPYTLIILITHSAYKLPVTLLSRCQKISIPRPEKAQLLHWMQSRNLRESTYDALDVSRLGPLNVIAMDATARRETMKQVLREFTAVLQGEHDPVILAGDWEQTFDEDRLEWIMIFVRDMVHQKYNLHEGMTQDGEMRTLLDAVGQKVSLPELYRYWELLLNTRRKLGGASNQRLLLEELLITGAQLSRA